MRQENKFWKRIKSQTSDVDVLWTRIETGIILPGVPDLHGLYKSKSFWLELKISKLKKSLRVDLSPHQIGWQYLHASKGALVWNLVHRPSSSEVYLCNGNRSPSYGVNNLDPDYDFKWKDDEVHWPTILDYIVDYD